MTPEEMTVLLGFIEGIDKRIVLNERTVSAWSNVLPKSITLQEAMQYVREHYLEHDKAVLPAHVVGRHRMYHTPLAAPKVESDHDCMNGYIIITELTEKGHAYEAASPCPECTKPQHQSARIVSERQP